MTRVLAHVPDIAWIIALWKAIHGGDPGPQEREIAALIAGEAKAFAEGKEAKTIAVSQLQAKFKSIGVALSVSEAEAAPTHAGAERLKVHQGTQVIRLCFGVGAARKCLDVTIPKVSVAA